MLPPDKPEQPPEHDAPALLEAISQAEEAVATGRELPPAENPEIAVQMLQLGDFYRQAGKIDRAILIYSEALQIIEEFAYETHGYYRIANEIATLCDQQGNPENAAIFYERAIKISEKCQGVDLCEVATILNNLAMTCKALGKPAEAEGHYHKALEIYERVRGSDHPDVAAMLNNLGALYTAEKDFDMAEVMHLRALSLRQKAFGTNHPDVAQSLSNLAVVYHSKQNWNKAGNYYRDALDVLGKQARTDWDEYAIILHNYADFLRQTGKSRRADDLEKELQSRLNALQ